MPTKEEFFVRALDPATIPEDERALMLSRLLRITARFLVSFLVYEPQGVGNGRELHQESVLLTASEVSRLLGVSSDHVYKLALRGDLPSIKIGRSRRFRKIDIDKLSKGGIGL